MSSFHPVERIDAEGVLRESNIRLQLQFVDGSPSTNSQQTPTLFATSRG